MCWMTLVVGIFVGANIGAVIMGAVAAGREPHLPT
jgi:hypothetical protein